MADHAIAGADIEAAQGLTAIHYVYITDFMNRENQDNGVKPKLAFVFNPKIPPFAAMAEELRRIHGVHTPEEADVVIPVGGDGSVFCGVREAHGKKVYPIVPSDSNSVAYLANRFAPGDDLLAAIKNSTDHPVYSLTADVTYATGKTEKFRAFNDFAIVADSAQAAFLELKHIFNAEAKNEEKGTRYSCDGMIFSTPMGSTGWSSSYNGPIIPMENQVFLFTGMGVMRPHPGPVSIIAKPDESFRVDCVTSRGKRPLRIAYDGKDLRPESIEDPFSRITIRMDKDPWAWLARNNDQPRPTL